MPREPLTPPRFDDLPEMVTVEEMAAYLRIARNAAYEPRGDVPRGISIREKAVCDGWSRLFERRGWRLSELQSWSDMGLTAPTSSGATVTPQTAASVPAVFACLQVLSQDVARTPVKLR